MRDFGLLTLRANGKPITPPNVVRGIKQRISEGDPTLAMVRIMAVSWVKSGMPVIEVSHRLAASFACTVPTVVSLTDIEWPWTAFWITTPLLPCQGILVDDYTSVTRIDAELGASVSGGACCFYVDNDGNHGTVCRGTSRVGLMNDWAEITRTDHGNVLDRTQLLMRRVAYGAIMELNTMIPKVRQRYERSQKASRRTGEPTQWTFQLTRPVRLDMREAVQKYLSGGVGGKLAFQFMVRGHWKHQPCGPGGAHRKLIHVEPYWKGDPESPIAAREHVLQNDHDSRAGAVTHETERDE